jgi:hypothetical protein
MWMRMFRFMFMMMFVLVRFVAHRNRSFIYHIRIV